jgi:hypothetical protein
VSNRNRETVGRNRFIARLRLQAAQCASLIAPYLLSCLGPN